MNIISRRHSVRRYADRPVEAEKVEQLMRAAMQAPSAGNQQPWEFIVVRDRANLERLSHCSKYAGPVGDAPLGIVLLADTARMRFPDNWEQDMGAAAENILLEATDLGLGGVWLGIQGEDERVESVRDMFALPSNIRPYAVLAIGYPVEPDVTPASRYDAARVHFEGWEA